MEDLYDLVVLDETGQKESHLTTPGSTPWAEVGARSVERLGLPSHMGGEPVIYHLYDDKSGQGLLPRESVGEVVREVEIAFRVRIAPEMKPAHPGDGAAWTRAD